MEKGERKVNKKYPYFRRTFGFSFFVRLTLTKKAQDYYDGCGGFLKIYEYEPEDGKYLYTLQFGGDDESRLMTEDELNACLEQFSEMEDAL